MTSFDHDADVLTVQHEGCYTKAWTSGHDDMLRQALDGRGNIVGVELLEATTVNREEWQAHPDRNALPWDIRAALDEWFEGR